MEALFSAVESAVTMGCSPSDINAELLRHQVVHLQVERLWEQRVHLSHPALKREVVWQELGLSYGTAFQTGQWVHVELRVQSLQEPWHYWARSPGKTAEKAGGGDLRVELRSLMETEKPRPAVSSKLKAVLKGKGVKGEDQDFARASLDLLSARRVVVPKVEAMVSEPVEDWLERMKALFEEQNAWESLDRPEDLVEVVLRREELSERVFKESMIRSDESCAAFQAWTRSIQWKGTITGEGSGYAFIRSDLFAKPIFVHRGQVVEGDLIDGAKCTFEVDVVPYDGANRFAAHQVHSRGRRVVETTPHWMVEDLDDLPKRTLKGIKHALESRELVLVLVRHGGDGVPLSAFSKATGIPRGDLKAFEEVFPEIDFEIPDAVGVVARPAGASWESCHKKAHRRRITRALYPIWAPRVLERDRGVWTILMDETGPCDDFKGRRGKELRMASTMMALLVPPGHSSAPVPHGLSRQ